MTKRAIDFALSGSEEDSKREYQRLLIQAGYEIKKPKAESGLKKWRSFMADVLMGR